MAGTATLISGMARIPDHADLVNMSVGTVRTRYAQVAAIPSGARAQVNNEEVGDDYILQAGDTLVFDQPTGTKG